MSDDIPQDIEAIARIDVVPKILDVICRTTGLGFAAVARVTRERWVACAVRDNIDFGLAVGGELEIATTICNEIRQTHEAVVIDHVDEDPAFRDHHTPRLYGFQSYISTPIYWRGEFFGTLCAIDPRPANLRTSDAIATFELFAALIGSHLDAQDRLAKTEAALSSERGTSELREQFIAVLGHDLRNPLAAIDGGVRLLGKAPAPERSARILDQMEQSVRRMAGLIDDILDFARGRLGGGIDIEMKPNAELAAVLALVVDEFRTAQPDRRIEADIVLPHPIVCDSRRLAQLASNLVANALIHGAEDAPVQLSAQVQDGAFILSVANEGRPIKSSAIKRLFQPFTRASVRPSQQGLGLGLYIASEVASAHGGVMSVASDVEETRFTFTMPLRP